MSKHIDQLLQLLEISHAYASKVSIYHKADLTIRKEQEPKLSKENQLIYYKAVGLVRFIVDTVHYKAAYAASQLARSLHYPSYRHFSELKHLVRYLSGQKYSYIEYFCNGDGDLLAFSDSDYPTCRDTRRSRTGIAAQFAGDIIYWRSSLQKSVTLSSSEAEYIASSDAARVFQWLQQVAEEWHIPISYPAKLLIDNTSAIAMRRANGPTTRSKHIDTRAHYLRERVKNKSIAAVHIPTTQHVADLLTKALSSPTIKRLIDVIKSTKHSTAED